jgi:hypothetical protein
MAAGTDSTVGVHTDLDSDMPGPSDAAGAAAAAAGVSTVACDVHAVVPSSVVDAQQPRTIVMAQGAESESAQGACAAVLPAESAAAAADAFAPPGPETDPGSSPAVSERGPGNSLLEPRDAKYEGLVQHEQQQSTWSPTTEQPHWTAAGAEDCLAAPGADAGARTEFRSIATSPPGATAPHTVAMAAPSNTALAPATGAIAVVLSDESSEPRPAGAAVHEPPLSNSSDSVTSFSSAVAGIAMDATPAHLDFAAVAASAHGSGPATRIDTADATSHENPSVLCIDSACGQVDQGQVSTVFQSGGAAPPPQELLQQQQLLPSSTCCIRSATVTEPGTIAVDDDVVMAEDTSGVSVSGVTALCSVSDAPCDETRRHDELATGIPVTDATAATDSCRELEDEEMIEFGAPGPGGRRAPEEAGAMLSASDPPVADVPVGVISFPLVARSSDTGHGPAAPASSSEQLQQLQLLQLQLSHPGLLPVDATRATNHTGLYGPGEHSSVGVVASSYGTRVPCSRACCCGWSA